MNDAIALLGYCLIAVFGIFLAAGFCGIPLDKKTLPQLIAFTVVTLAIQGLCSWFWGFTFTRWIYPVILHVPLMGFLALCFRKSWVTALVSVLFAYMCCQIPLLISLLSYLFTSKNLYHDILYILAVPAAYIFLNI